MTGSTSKDPRVSWIARVAKTFGAGDDLKRRVEVVMPYRLRRPLPWASLVDSAPKQCHGYLSRNGALPERTGKRLLAALTGAAGDVAPHLARLGTVDGGIPIETRSDEVLQQTRDATLASVRMAGFDPGHIAGWSLSGSPNQSFIERIQHQDGPSHEDDMITHDAHRFRDCLGPEDWLNRSAFRRCLTWQVPSASCGSSGHWLWPDFGSSGRCGPRTGS